MTKSTELFMQNLKAIIFDLDGVIINSEILWDACAHELLQYFGLTYRREQSKHLCTGKTFVEGTTILKDIYRIPEDLTQLIKRRKTIIRRLYAEKIDFLDGFPKIRPYLQNRNLKTAIATSCDRELVTIVDDKLGLTKIFREHIYTLDLVNFRSKPNPDLFLYTARQLKVAPEVCVVIEDSPNGVQAAKNARMQCIGLTGTYSADILSTADVIANNYDEIIEIFFNK